MSDRWRSWARRCIEAIDAAPAPSDPGKLDALGQARASFEDVERTGLEPYWTLKSYAVRELGLDDGDA